MIRRWPFLIVVGLALVALTGCGADLRVETRLDSRGGGERVYTITVSPSDLDMVGLSPDVLLAVINAARPAGADLSVAMNRGSGSVSYELRFAFRSPDELREHARALLGRDPGLAVEVGGPPLAPHVRFSDPNEPESYFEWLRQALLSRGITTYQSDWVNSARAFVSLAGEEVELSPPGRTSAEQRWDLPAHQDLYVQWDPLRREGLVDVYVGIMAQTRQELIDTGRMEAFWSLLRRQIPGEWQEVQVPTGHYRYWVKVPFSGDYGPGVAQVLGQYLGLRVESQEKPGPPWWLRDRDVTFAINPVAWLGTTDVDNITRLDFSNWAQVELLYSSSPDVQVPRHAVYVRSGDAPMEIKVRLRYPNVVAWAITGAVALAAAAASSYLVLRRRRWRGAWLWTVIGGLGAGAAAWYANELDVQMLRVLPWVIVLLAWWRGWARPVVFPGLGLLLGEMAGSWVRNLAVAGWPPGFMLPTWTVGAALLLAVAEVPIGGFRAAAGRALPGLAGATVGTLLGLLAWAAVRDGLWWAAVALAAAGALAAGKLAPGSFFGLSGVFAAAYLGWAVFEEARTAYWGLPRALLITLALLWAQMAAARVTREIGARRAAGVAAPAAEEGEQA